MRDHIIFNQRISVNRGKHLLFPHGGGEFYGYYSLGTQLCLETKN